MASEGPAGHTPPEFAVKVEVTKTETHTEMPDLSSEMYEGIRVVNLSKAKSVLKRELFDFLKNSSQLRQLGIKTIHIHFTKCGRYAMTVGRSRLRSFGLRLACLDPHHQLTMYLLGVSNSLESALLHAAARVKQIEDDMDWCDRTFKHGDIIYVDHLGYSHVAVYDAERDVMYELVGDIDSGKDALLAEWNSAVQWHINLGHSTQTHLRNALAHFRPSEKSETDVSITCAVIDTVKATFAEPKISISAASSVTTETSELSVLSESSSTVDSALTHESIRTSPGPLEAARLGLASLPKSESTPAMSSMIEKTTVTTTTTTLTGQLSGSTHLTRDPVFVVKTESKPPVITLEAPKPLFTMPKDSFEQKLSPMSRRSILATSGHVVAKFKDDKLFFNESAMSTSSDAVDELAQDLADRESARVWQAHLESDDDSEGSYDGNSHVITATQNLRRLAASWDDIGLKDLLGDDESSYVTSAERDESIVVDDMSPALAFGFASHSIAEVQATPKDSFLARDPLLRKRVVEFGNAQPPEIVIGRARAALGCPGWNPISKNCEHFATWAKTGKTISTQVYEIGSSAAIFGAWVMQSVISIAFMSFLTCWFLGLFMHTPILHTCEHIIKLFLKYGVGFASVAFLSGLFIHWGNGISCDFEKWIKKTANSPKSNSTSPRGSMSELPHIHHSSSLHNSKSSTIRKS